MSDDTVERPPAFTGPVDPGEYRRVLEAFTGVPATEGNRVEVLRNGVEIFPAMLEAIEGAERTVDLLTFIYGAGEISRQVAGALADRARAGVRVRVLLDAFGARGMPDTLVARMRRAGAQVERFHPLSWKVWRWNVRNHRRVLVCDDAVALTGGAGIAGEWMGDARHPGERRDTHFKVVGPAVDPIHAAFYADWFEVPRPVFDAADHFPHRERAGAAAVQVVRAASQPGWNDAALALRALIALARERIRVTTAYFRPPAHFVELLCDAVRRGVEVEVLVPGPHAEPVHYRWAAEYHYDRLLEGGVRVWRYRPTMQHAKIVTVDGTVAMVGTSNFDARSFAVNEQIDLLVHDRAVTSTLDEHFAEDRERSDLLDRATWAARGRAQRGRELTAHVATFGLRGGGATRRDGLAG